MNFDAGQANLKLDSTMMVAPPRPPSASAPPLPVSHSQCSRFGPLSVCDPHGRALRVRRGPRAPLAPMSFISGLRPDGKASARPGGPRNHRGRRCLATRARKLCLVHARCCRGASEAAQVGGGARQLEWVRSDKTDRPDPRPTPLATYRRCRGPVASHCDLPRRSARRMEPARTLLEPMHGSGT